MDLIDEAVMAYHQKMSLINLYKRDVASSTRRESEELSRLQNLVDEKPELEGDVRSLHNMFYYSAFDGEPKFYSQEELSLSDAKCKLRLRKNKQYQWLLAESYEEFEDFVERIYAVAGFEDNDFWSARHFGDEKLSDIGNKGFDWFLERAKDNKVIGANTAIKKIRREVPKVERMERNNESGVNLRFLMEVVRFFRHAIVHTGGVVENKERMKIRIIKAAGVENDPAGIEEYKKFIESYFLIEGYPDVVSVLEVSFKGEPSFITHDSFEHIVSLLMAYADVLSTCLREKIYK